MKPGFPAGAMLVAGCLVLAACNSRESLTPGYVEGEYVYVSAPVTGKLQTLNVSRGAKVEQGANLFDMENTPQLAQRDAARARLMQAQAMLQDSRKGQRPTELDALQAQYQQSLAAQRLAEAELNRLQKLLGTPGGASEQDVDRARVTHEQTKEQVSALSAQIKTARLGARADQVTAAQANVDALQALLTQAEWELGQTRQLAPAAGVIADTLFLPGEFVAAGRPIVVLLPPTNVKVRAYVSESMLTSVPLESEVTIHVDGHAQTITGKVRFISPTLEFTPPVVYSKAMRSKFVSLVEISLAPSDATALHPGQPVDVEFGR